LEYALRVRFSILVRGCARPEWDMAGAHSFCIQKSQMAKAAKMIEC